MGWLIELSQISPATIASDGLRLAGYAPENRAKLGVFFGWTLLARPLFKLRQFGMKMATGKYHRDLAERKRGQIVNAARRLFIDRGFEDMTMVDVAAAANVSAMTLYKHFPSKDDLLAVILDALREDIEEVLGASIDRTAEPREALTDYVERYCEFIGRDDEIESMRRLIAIAPKFPDHAKRFREQSSALLHDKLSSYFDELIDRGILRPHKTMDSAGQILGYLMNSLMLSQLLDRHQHENPQLPDELAEVAIDTFFRAYGR